MISHLTIKKLFDLMIMSENKTKAEKNVYWWFLWSKNMFLSFMIFTLLVVAVTSMISKNIINVFHSLKSSPPKKMLNGYYSQLTTIILRSCLFLLFFSLNFGKFIHCVRLFSAKVNNHAAFCPLSK